uniref:(California timema) hypothetical protein n=1 Tax=Timema californicum TaxID=61474 RepID=A0A7R9P516_TIMCA|nr:unnamed protein product [Timema californicum]
MTNYFSFYFILISLKTSEISKFPQTSTNCEIGQRVRTKWLLNKIYNFKKINNPHVQLYKFHKTLSQKIINKSIHYTKIVYLTDSKIAMCRCCTATTASLYESSFLPNSFVELQYSINQPHHESESQRFPSLLGFVPAKKAASEIIKAMRTNQNEVSIPNGLLLLNHILRLFPTKAIHLIKDFMDSGVESHD